MASRKEEKEARRATRIEQEQAEAVKQARKKRVGIIAGVTVLAAAIVVAVVLLVSSFGGGGEMDNHRIGKHEGSDIEAVAIPDQKLTNLSAAAKKVGCTVNNYKNFGRDHTTDAVTFKTNPPTSGKHYPEPADDGAYGPADTPSAAKLVHSLEHGRIIIQYKPGLPKKDVGQLKSVFDEDNSYHMLLVENQTDMPYEVAVTAWTKSLTCKKFNQDVFDAIRTFRDKYVDKGPEFIP